MLVNGKRYIPTTGDGVVDITGIPTALVDRVEVMTGGASAVYGSDAIAGVVNFILDNQYEGFELGGSYDLTTDYGDGDIYSINAKFGANSADGRGILLYLPIIQAEAKSCRETARIRSLHWMTELSMAYPLSCPAVVPRLNPAVYVSRQERHTSRYCE